MTPAGGIEAIRFGQYSVIRKIASGGMAEVYLCRLDSGHGFTKKMAVKAIHHDLSGDDAFREMFAREARLASSLSHPNVVSVFDFGYEADRCYIVMEYIDGWSLSEIMFRMREDGMRVPLPLWRFWMESVFSGLGYLHARGVIHRDVSPGNILVARSGAVKISDFGISRKSFNGSQGISSIDGKIGYMAPEALEGAGNDPRSDLYSAGLIGAELLLGRPVFHPTTLQDARRMQLDFDPATLHFPANEANAEVVGIIRKTLAFEPESRFQDADAICMAIEAAIPFRATRTEGEAFWDSLFPGRPDDVTELDIDSNAGPGISVGESAIVRESRSPYGSRARGVAIGVAAVFSIAAGGSFIRDQLRRPLPGDAPSIDRTRSNHSSPAVSVPPEIVRSTLPVELRRKSNDIHESGRGSIESTIPVGKRGVPENAAVAAVPARPAIGVVPVIQAIPWAKVYEGERYLGDTPLRAVEFPVGDHRLRFVNEPLGADRIMLLKVAESDNQKLIVTLVGSRSTD